MPEGGFGIYVHWPFCQAKCPYCDFNSHVWGSVDDDAFSLFEAGAFFFVSVFVFVDDKDGISAAATNSTASDDDGALFFFDDVDDELAALGALLLDDDEDNELAFLAFDFFFFDDVDLGVVPVAVAASSATTFSAVLVVGLMA